MAASRLTVIIPVHNGASTLERCLEAVFASEGASPEVVVVDDGSTDATPEILARFPVRVVRHDIAHGAAAARNAGAREAATELICFVDSDIVVRPDTFAEVLRSLVGDGGADGVDGVVGMLARDTEVPGFASQYENLYMHFMYLEHAEEMDIFYTSLAAIRRGVFIDSGGFDETYAGAGIEDMELGQRLVRTGHGLRLNKNLQVHHLKRFGLVQLLRINRRKATGTLRIWLRNRGEGLDNRKHVGPGWSFLLGIPGSGAGLAGVATGLILGLPVVWGAAFAVLLAVALMNGRFLSFLAATNGITFLAASIPFFYVQFVNYGIGLTLGLAGYIFGDKH